MSHILFVRACTARAGKAWLHGSGLLGSSWQVLSKESLDIWQCSRGGEKGLLFSRSAEMQTGGLGAFRTTAATSGPNEEAVTDLLNRGGTRQL